jgi:hypothetical protein
MGITNPKQKNRSLPGMPVPSDNTDVIILKQMLEQMEQVVNNQADALRRSHNKISEILFKMGKMDEQIQLNKINLRCEKDKNLVYLHSMIHLGIVEAESLAVVQNIVQNKILPINSEGQVRASIKLSRYQCSPDMPNPQGDAN